MVENLTFNLVFSIRLIRFRQLKIFCQSLTTMTPYDNNHPIVLADFHHLSHDLVGNLTFCQMHTHIFGPSFVTMEERDFNSNICLHSHTHTHTQNVDKAAGCYGCEDYSLYILDSVECSLQI